MDHMIGGYIAMHSCGFEAQSLIYVTGPAKIGHVGYQNLSKCWLYSNMATKFQSLLIIYLALQHYLQNPNTKFCI